MWDASEIRALSFDTGGTVLDWHSGFRTAFAQAGRRHGLERDWTTLANELRSRALGRTLNMGRDEPPPYNIDEVHRRTLDELCSEFELDAFTDDERHGIAWTAIHSLDAWPDFGPVLPRLRSRYPVCSHTVLSFRIIVDTARHNGLDWDAVFSCEAIGIYKTLPESYETVAGWLALEPSQIMKVACHATDLNAARAVGYRTAFVLRPDEWGTAPVPDPADIDPGPDCDIVVDTFDQLADALGV